MANPYNNTGRAGTSSPANFGWLRAAGKALLKRFTKSKPASNFKPFHRDGVTYDTKMINDAFEQRFGRPTVERPKYTAIRDSRNVTPGPVTEMSTKIINPKSTFDYMLPPASGAIGYAIAKNEEEVKKNKANQKREAIRQGR